MCWLIEAFVWLGDIMLQTTLSKVRLRTACISHSPAGINTSSSGCRPSSFSSSHPFY